MNDGQAQALASRFIRLVPEKRKIFLEALARENVDFATFPIVSSAGEPTRCQLSYAQQRMWFLWQLDPESAAYNLPTVTELNGPLNVEALTYALNSVVTRHEVLRTLFPTDDQGQPYQLIRDNLVIDINVENLVALLSHEQDEAVRESIERESLIPFNLVSGPLLRVKLVAFAGHRHVLMITLHHIVADGWSINILIDELMRFYEAYAAYTGANVKPLPIQYADYALWQRAWLESGELQRQLDYWCEQLEGDQPVLQLPIDHARTSERSFIGARYEWKIDDHLVKGLRMLARQHNASLFMVLLAVFKVLLYRYTSEPDIRIGVPVANRHRSETEGLIGCFINTQVMRTEIDFQDTFADLLEIIRKNTLNAQTNQDLPFEQLVEALQPERNLTHNPLFQVLFNHQVLLTNVNELSTSTGLRMSQFAWEKQTTEFDLKLDTWEKGDALFSAFTYATDLFERETIERLAHHWQRILSEMVRDPLQRVSELPILSDAEIHRILREWNTTEIDYGEGSCIHSLFEAQVEKTPEAIALTFPAQADQPEQTLTYAQLNGKANQLAHALRRMGVGPDVLVGIAVERSIEMVIGLLGILKAGGAYVPLDPEYPQDRLSYMMADSGIGLLLTQERLQERLPISEGVQVLNLDGQSEADWRQESDENLPLVMLPGNLAYVIYTSGSTGKPKGTLLAHCNVSRLMQATEQWFHFDSKDVWTLFHSYAFDFSVWEMFGALLYGGKLLIVPRDIARATDDFYRLLCDYGVTVLNQTPSAFRQLMEIACSKPTDAMVLRHVIFGGEALAVETLQPWFACFGDQIPQLTNMYGITETTVHVTYRPLSEQDQQGSPIGERIHDLSWYVLDGVGQPVAPGCTGELLIGGAGLARGYYGKPGLTAERFLPDPYDERGGGRLYRTGDLARYQSDGNIEYIGRIDHQVKIRGFRIELGEIESQLNAQAEVREAVVIAHQVSESGGQQLVAYVIPSDSTLVNEVVDAEAQDTFRVEMKVHLQQTLPEYMVPNQYVLLNKLPLTPNGKLDRKALPKVDSSAFTREYQVPQTELEQQLAAIWQEVLGVERVGLNDNFFELGGDSIVAIQLVSRARQKGIHFIPKDIFQRQTLASLSVVAKEVAEAVQIDQGLVKGTLQLIPIQQWFFEEAIPQRHHWNQSVLLKPFEPLQPEVLQMALEHLLYHHDALRLSFTEREDQRWQAIFLAPEQADKDLLWQISVSGVEELEVLCNEAQRSLDLERGPLLRAVLADLPEGEQRLLLVIHHLVVDGVSWRVLLEDLQTVYRQAESGQTIQLPTKTSSVQMWSGRLQQYAQSEALQQELTYWQTELAGIRGDLPRDKPEGSLRSKFAKGVTTHLDKAWTERLLKEAPSAYRTQINDLLLTALARVIARWADQESILVQLEGHGREDLFEDIDLTRTVGWFTTKYPVKLSPSESLGYSIKIIKEQLRAIPNKGLGYGVLRHLSEKVIQQQLGQLPEARITFNYLGQFDGSFDADEGLFKPSGEGSGSDKSPEAPLGNWLTINGRIYNGELNLSWSFNGEMYRIETIQALADEYALEFQAVIEHCCNKENYAVTPSDFPLVNLTQAQLDTLPIPAAEIEDIYSLSPMQQGMLFYTTQDNDAGVYINQTIVTIEGLHYDQFVAAWEQVVRRHEILRTGFLVIDDLAEPLQIVHKKAHLSVTRLDWSGRDITEAALQRLAKKDCDNSFNLLVPPLMRLTLVKLNGDRYYLIWTRHHILMDGWSSSLLIGEVMALYFGRSLSIRESRYRDYIQWLQTQSRMELERFWTGVVAPLEEPTLLANTIYPKPMNIGEGHEAVYLNWSADKTRRLNQWSQYHRITPNTLIQGVWLLLLQRFTGQDTVCFGSTVAGRPTDLPGINNVLGLFINTLPVIQTPRAEQMLLDWLRQLQGFNLAIRDFEHAPLADIQRWACLPGQSLFDSIIVFENYPIDKSLQDAGDGRLEIEAVSSRDVTNYAMDLAINLGDTLEVEFMYMPHRFSRAAVEVICHAFETLLADMLDNPNARLGNLKIMAEHALSSIGQLKDFSTIPIRHDDGKLIAELISEQAAQRDGAVAMLCGGARLTYTELEQRANQLAHYLIANGIGQETCVGVALPRSVDTIVAFYAVLKTGAAYVPLDIDYPRERLRWSIEDSGMNMLITDTSAQKQLVELTVATVMTIDSVILDTWPDYCPTVTILAENPAYIIYTSGSTGKPKGVSVTHGALAMHCRAIAKLYEMGTDTRELLFMSFAFDGAQERCLTILLSGGCLVVRDNRLWTPEETWQALHRHRITIACFPPAYLQQLAEFAQIQESAPPSVDIYCFGGDAVAEANFELVKCSLKPRYLTNGYGPTETVITPLLWKTDSTGVCEAPYAPIGYKVGERSLVVLDKQLNPVPAGVVGELYIGGAGLARGYHRRPSLTAERFVADSFSSNGGRLYRTGDLVRYRQDGMVDYIGRADHQVKIRGFRIELGEIEAHLRQQPPVQDAIVIARDSDQGKQLFAYVVLEHPEVNSEWGENLRRQLAATLPNYMVPAKIQVMPTFPLGPNGKVDRNALPDIHLQAYTFVAPRNEIEQMLADIWREALGVERIGVTDNFFELGGDSLRVLKVLSKVRMQSAIDFNIKLKDMMSKPTIAELSGYSSTDNLPASPLLPLNHRGTDLPMLFCPHAGFGTIFDYEPLARQLEGHYTVYGIRCRMLLDTSWNDQSLQSMAVDYVNEIRHLQPNGPYHLLGWSLGGTLAALMADEFERQGEIVAFLGLVDTFIPRPDTAVVAGNLLEDLRGFITHVFGLSEQQLPPVDGLVVDDPVAITQFFVDMQNDFGRDTLYKEVDATELGRIFAVGMKLKQLSQQLQAMPTVVANIYFWWAGTTTGHSVEALESTFSGKVASDNILRATHYDILKHDGFLQTLARYLVDDRDLAVVRPEASHYYVGKG